MKNNKKTDNKLNIIILFLLASFAVNIILACALVKNKDEAKADIKHFSEENEKLKSDANLKESTDKKSFDLLYSKKLKKLLDDAEIITLAQKQWDYVLTVNGSNVSSKTLYIDNNNVMLVLAEIKNKEDILPADLLDKGKVTGGDPNDSLDSHFKVASLAEFTKSLEQKDGDNRIIYKFKNIPHGTIISINISDMLKYRLNFQNDLDDNKIELIYK